MLAIQLLNKLLLTSTVDGYIVTMKLSIRLVSVDDKMGYLHLD